MRPGRRGTGGSVTALRYHNVYGPGMPRDTPYAGVAAIFRSALAAGRAPEVFEDGGQRRDFVHVRDVAAANVTCARAAAARPERTRVQRRQRCRAHHRRHGRVARGRNRWPAPVISGRFRLGDVRHVTASSDAGPGGARVSPLEVGFEVGMREFAIGRAARRLTLVQSGSCGSFRPNSANHRPTAVHALGPPDRRLRRRRAARPSTPRPRETSRPNRPVAFQPYQPAVVRLPGAPIST